MVGYWDELLRHSPEELAKVVAGGIAMVAAAGIPYLLILGAQPPQNVAEWLTRAVPQMKIEVWADTGHFPHLAHPARFAERLAATGQWRGAAGE